MYPYKQCNVFLAIKTKEVDYRVMIFPNWKLLTKEKRKKKLKQIFKILNWS